MPLIYNKKKKKNDNIKRQQYCNRGYSLNVDKDSMQVIK